MISHRSLHPRLLVLALSITCFTAVRAQVGVGAKPIEGAEVLLDGSRKMLDAKWTYWQGPRFASSMPIKWKIVEDPVDPGTPPVPLGAPRLAAPCGSSKVAKPYLLER